MNQEREHEFDGIKEYDNPLPGWWTGLFWATIVFAGAYWAFFHMGGGGKSIEAAYAEEVAADTVQKAALVAAQPVVSEQTLAALMNDPAAVAEGKAKFSQVCVACHTATGGGLVGPNLTDKFWKSGNGSLVSIHKVVHDGVIEKGMIPWASQMSPDLLNKVVAYVGTLRNTNVPGGKAPEGNPVE